MRHNNSKIIWVEALGIFDFIWLWIEILFSRACVRYDEKNISGVVASLISILQRHGLCKKFYKAELTLDKKDAAGYALTYYKEADFDICLNKFCQRYIPAETDIFKSTVKLYISLYLNHGVTFVTMVAGSDEFKQSGRVNVIYIARHPLNSVIKQFYQERGYALRESGLFFAYVQYFLRPFYRFASLVAKRIFPGRVKTNIYEPKPSIWIEHYHNSIGFPFYLNALDKNKFDIVCYLDRNDNVHLKEEIKSIEDMHLKWIDLRAGSFVRFANLGVGQFWDMFCSLFCGYSGVPLWIRVFRFEFRMHYLLYKAVFSRFKVKVLMQHQDWSWAQEAQKRALEDAGGIMLGYHWSNCIFYKQAVYFTPQHVYFVWGKMMYEYLQKRGDIIRHVLPSGIWFGPSGDDSSAVKMRDDLKFIMAIFDSSVSYNIHQSEEALAGFYLKIFQMLEKNPGWGGIIKSRTWSRINDLEFLPHGKEIVSKAALLIEEKRLVFLNCKVSPVSAAVHADISVCYGLNSAGIISGIYGQRVIHCDSSGWLHYPLYKDSSQKVIFQSLDDALRALVMVSEGNTQIGDFSKWKQVFNYFGDFNGQGRISDFIRSFMEDVVVSSDPIKSLDLVAERYKEVNNIGSAFFRNDGLWEDELK